MNKRIRKNALPNKAKRIIFFLPRVSDSSPPYAWNSALSNDENKKKYPISVILNENLSVK